MENKISKPQAHLIKKKRKKTVFSSMGRGKR